MSGSAPGGGAGFFGAGATSEMESTMESVKFEAWIKAGFALWKEHLLLLVAAGFFTAALGMASLLILAGPLWAGVSLLTLRMVDRPDHKEDRHLDLGDAGDIFDGFQFFLPALLLFFSFFIAYYLVFQFLYLFPLGIVAGAALLGFANLCMLLLADHRLDFWSTCGRGFDMVRNNLWHLPVFLVVSGGVSLSGVMALGIGLVVTWPLGLCVTAVAYREISAAAEEADGAEPAA